MHHCNVQQELIAHINLETARIRFSLFDDRGRTEDINCARARALVDENGN